MPFAVYSYVHIRLIFLIGFEEPFGGDEGISKETYWLLLQYGEI